MFNKHEIARNACQLYGGQGNCGYDWWWHSFTARSEKTGEEKPFFIEYFLCNPNSGGDMPVFGQLEENRKNGTKPSYLMVKAGSWGEDAAQLHRFFGWNNIEVSFQIPFSVKGIGRIGANPAQIGSHQKFTVNHSARFTYTGDKSASFLDQCFRFLCFHKGSPFLMILCF